MSSTTFTRLAFGFRDIVPFFREWSVLSRGIGWTIYSVYIVWYISCAVFVWFHFRYSVSKKTITLLSVLNRTSKSWVMLIIQTAVVHHDARKMLSGFYRIETSYMRSKHNRRKVILFSELSKAKYFKKYRF